MSVPTTQWLPTLLKIALPIALQTAIFSSKSMVDTAMLGSLGEQDMAAIGFAAKIQLVITFFVIGISIGGGQIAAQCLGERSHSKFLRSVMITLLLSLIASLLFFLPLILGSSALMSLGTANSEIIARGSDYLIWIAPSLFLFAITSSLATGMRVMQQPMPATVVSMVGVGLNVVLNYLFIFGFGDIPAMGIKGAALGTLFSALAETGLLIGYIMFKRHPLCGLSLTTLKQIRRVDIQIVMSLAFTAALNSVIWALGMFAFHAILGSRDDNLLIALGVLAPVESLAMALLIGIASAASVMVGNHVGAGAQQEIDHLVPRLMRLSCGLGISIFAILLVVKGSIVGHFFHQHSVAYTLTSQLFDIVAVSVILKSAAMMLIVGILRAGGDAKFCLYTDVFAQWAFLLPCSVLLSLTALPHYYLFSLMLIEEGIKVAICLWRLRSRSWCQNHAAAMQ
ncbi:MATE family efflux transporter [Thaumasiovibrio subtropicus]|uniref:MATE family efflux transporter n=1 Tax=Thaumasiovibrio subtropicus TaxID=1891207 RepID=UPI000B3500FF|nr:MATE family efflux transporter [Thaumasiovibrio subtropicus]